jgi:voltage-gated potassium channel Kch
MSTPNSKGERSMTQHTTATSSKQQVTNTNYEFFILALSVLSIFNLVMEILPMVDPYVKNLLNTIDIALTPVFLADFLYRLVSAPSKRRYLTSGGGWLDFIGSLPFPGLRVARLFRMWRVYRAVRHIGMRNVWRAYRQSRAESALLTIIFLSIVVIEFAGIFILDTERHDPTANIKTASDALWWAYVTVTTVGYGDKYPVTNAGRMVGALLMTIGVGLFGVLTGYLANAFLKPASAEQSETDDHQVADKESTTSNDMQAVLEEIRKIVLQQERYTADIQQRLEILDGKQETLSAEMKTKLGEIGELLHEKIE